MNDKINYWLFGISILMLGASLYLNINSLVITNESIVLVFVGILATFIVVGNFAQVAEIRNSTDKKIQELDLKTQNKIDELNVLSDKITESTKKLMKIEKEMYFNSAEGYRLYGIFAWDKDLFKQSTAYFIKALLNYHKAQIFPKSSSSIIEFILDNLKPEYWDKDVEQEFDYEGTISDANKLPSNFDQKQNIIDLLEKQKEKNKKK